MALNSTLVQSCNFPLSIAFNTASSTSYTNTNCAARLEEVEGTADGLRRSEEELPATSPQTNHTADLVAVIAVPRCFETSVCKVCVITDSEYIVLGAGEVARKWQQNGWVGSRRPLMNVGLWVELPDMLSHMGDRVQWVQVPSHVGLEGNEIVNDLAISGMCHNPL